MKLPDKNKPHDGAVGVIYARYSSHKQRDVSIEQQVAECNKKAKEMGLSIVDIYADRAITGKTDRRPNFQKMLRDAEKGKFQYLISWKSNRLGRNMLEAMINEQRLSEAFVRVLYVEEDFEDNAAGRFALRSMMNVNQFYSENLAEDIRRAMMDNARKCKACGKPPYGYKTGADLHFEIDEPKAAIVREVFTRVACGDKYIDIASSLNARGIKSATGRDWSKNSFQAMVRNERYRGIYIYDDVRIEDGMPRIISDELFFTVQEVIGMHKNVKGRSSAYGEYLLTGKLYCGECGSPMTGISGTSHTGAAHHYYICNGKREKICDKKNVRRSDIESAVAEAILNYICQDGVIEWFADKTVEYFNRKEEDLHITTLKDQISNTQQAIDNIMAAIEQGIITDTTKSRLLELEEDQKKAKEKLIAAQANIMPVDRKQLIATLSLYKNYKIEDRKNMKELFDAFLVAVYVYDDKYKIVFNFTNDSALELPITKKEIDTVGAESPNDNSSFKAFDGAPIKKHPNFSGAFLLVRFLAFGSTGSNFANSFSPRRDSRAAKQSAGLFRFTPSSDGAPVPKSYKPHNSAVFKGLQNFT